MSKFKHTDEKSGEFQLTDDVLVDVKYWTVVSGEYPSWDYPGDSEGEFTLEEFTFQRYDEDQNEWIEFEPTKDDMKMLIEAIEDHEDMEINYSQYKQYLR